MLFSITAGYKKIFTFTSLLISLLFFTACDKNERISDTAPPPPAAREYTLVYAVGDNGAIEGASLQKVHHGGAGSTVRAVPASGYHFVSWSDEEAAASRTDVDITSDLSVTAEFAPNRYALTYVGGDNGSIEGPRNQEVQHGHAGETVRAVPVSGYHFVKWSDGSETASRTDSDVERDITVTALFAPDQYRLFYAAQENGTILGSASQTVSHGRSGSEVRAVPAEGYRFAGWNDGSMANPRTDAPITADLAVTAAFERNRYMLTYSAGENGSIAGAGSQTVNHGEDGTPVTAVAEPGYHFVSWSDGVEAPSRNDSGMTGDLEVIAVFEVNTYSVGGTLSGLVEGTRAVLRNNGGDDLTLTENGEFRFATELLDGNAYAVTVLSQPTAPNQTCTVAAGDGTVSAGNVTDVVVKCVVNTYAVGGSVSGLPEGDQLVLRNNGGDDLIVESNGNFTFPVRVDDGRSYEVVIESQQLIPKWSCRVEKATGTLKGSEVTDVDVACFPKAELRAAVGIGRIDLDWNSADFKGAVFSLCRAKEEIPENAFSRCTDLRGGVMETGVRSRHAVTRVAYDITYWLQLEIRHPSGNRTYSDVITATPLSGINDTGIDWCSDNGANRQRRTTGGDKIASCKAAAETLPGQDGQQGRDAAALAREVKKRGSGSAGFDFSKMCMNGDVAGEGSCPPNPNPGNGAKNWACTLDNVTGLIWEVKTSGGLRNRDNTYTWYDPDEAANGGSPGVRNGGQCEGSDCDTASYVQAVNAKKLCGASDWRVPTRMELLSIVNNGRSSPAADSVHFPKTADSYYWSASTCSDEPDAAWQVYFRFGEVSPREKSQSHYIRLVRKAQ